MPDTRWCLIRGGIVVGMAFVVLACGETPTHPGKGPVPREEQVFIDQKAAFELAIKDLGTATRIDFEDYDASPSSDTISGRPQFDPRRYASRGIVFSSPRNVPFYIAPGGLFWNPTNSLSAGRFPFDSGSDPPYDAADDLVVSLEPSCSAVAFSVIDKGDLFEFGPANRVDFVGENGMLIRRLGFPAMFLGYIAPAFATPNRPAPVFDVRIVSIVITEAANDGDDVTYDDFVCVR